MKRPLLEKLSVAAFALSLAACSSVTLTPEQAAVWIAAFTPEQIDVGARIRLEATDSLMSVMDTSCSLEKVFRFLPPVKGEAVCTNDGRYIDFLPEEGELAQGKEYRCRVDMSLLTGKHCVKDFAFSFQVDRRQTAIKDVKAFVDPSNAELFTVEGIIEFSIPPSPDCLDSKKLVCSDNQATLQLNAAADPTQCGFRISGIRRRRKDSKLLIEYRPVAEFSKSKTSLTVPGLAEFKLLSAERNEAVQPYIELAFSAPLDASQDLDGLVSIDGVDQVRIERKGTIVRLFYPVNGITDMVVRISELLRSAEGRTLNSEIEQHIEQEVLPPAVEIPVSGTILPDKRSLTLPFRAVNLAAVDVEVVKVYSDNLLTFLQGNSLNSTNQLRRTGRLIYRQTVRLDKDKSLNLHQWQNFSVDLKNLFREERGALYSVRFYFSKAYSLYNKSQIPDFEPRSGVSEKESARWDGRTDYDWRSAPDYDMLSYKWRESDDPSKDSYFMTLDHMPEYNLAASNLGLIVKRAETDQLWCSVSDILTTSPLEGIRVKAYNYQMRQIGSACTDSQGFADFRSDGNPFVITASDGVSTTYLKLNASSELSTSNFDVKGKTNPEGIRSFVYGERGVWRPGDDIHLTLIVEDKQHTLPENHPVTVELYTPDGHIHDRQTLPKSSGGLYCFNIRTEENVPTGSWDACFKVGGQTIHQKVRVETIKPNRLKLNIVSPDLLSAGNDAEMGIEAHWLTGPAADGLIAKMEMTYYPDPRPFKQYGNWIFTNPLLQLSGNGNEAFSGRLDSLGRIRQAVHIPAADNAPGMLQANLIARVTESGGDESICSSSVHLSPYDAYVGIRLGEGQFETDSDLRFPVVVLDSDGNKLDGRELEYSIYRLGWSWWNEGSASGLRRYVQSSSAETVACGKLMAKDGRAEVPFRLNYPDWGKFLVFVRDTKSGHASGGKILVDWPDWRGHSGKTDPTASTVLSFALDKNDYEAGDIATVYLPAAAGARVLLSVENGSRVLSRRWVCLSAGKETAYKLAVTKEMAPNFYVHATLIQPHAQTVNDLPVRMYGVVGAEVADRSTVLHPEIRVADEIRPQQEFSVRISERDGKPMSYTLAIVDEGLLDITAFKTPDPWRAMNQREALGVRTWDMYSDVMGAYAGKFTSVLSIGGDEALRASEGKEKRFNPVVRFLGPFTLKAGSKTHRITLPMYVGSVRVMVVAAHGGCYGSTDKTVSVRSPLMLLPTLPRTLACGDCVKVPVNVFSTIEGAADVAVNIKVEGPASIAGNSARTLSFAQAGEKMAEFELQCDKRKSGKARVVITAQGGGESVSESVSIDIRNPQPVITTIEEKTVAAGRREQFKWNGAGEAKLELATMPAISFSGAFSFIANYRHLCTEQLSSKAMNMLYARRFLDESGQKKAEDALPSVLKALLSRQLPNGGFAYWPDDDDAHEWVSSMVGEVMAEARRQGFAVDSKAFGQWVKFQNSSARDYRHSTEYAADLVQSYRLYTLVLAGETPVAAMNRLRESKSLSRQALLRLASAYSLIGRMDVVEKLLEKEGTSVEVIGNYATFHSPLRDMAMELEDWILIGKMEKAAAVAGKVAHDFSPEYCSTQQLAFVSVAMSRLSDVMGGGDNVSVISENGCKPIVLRGLRGVKTLSLNALSESVDVENRGSGEVYLSLTTTHQASAEDIVPAVSSGLDVNVFYTGLKGQVTEVDRVSQGEEFLANIEVVSRTVESESLALTYAIPSGWEIWNDRLIKGADDSGERNTDIRDGQISWYFGMKKGEKRKFSVRLRAAWAGQFILPATVCEDMYDARSKAVIPNRSVVVVK